MKSLVFLIVCGISSVVSAQCPGGNCRPAREWGRPRQAQYVVQAPTYVYSQPQYQQQQPQVIYYSAPRRVVYINPAPQYIEYVQPQYNEWQGQQRQRVLNFGFFGSNGGCANGNCRGQ